MNIGDRAGAYEITDVMAAGPKGRKRYMLRCIFCGSTKTTQQISNIRRANGTRCKECPPKTQQEMQKEYYERKKLRDPTWLAVKSACYRAANLEKRRAASRASHHSRKRRALTDDTLAAQIKQQSAQSWARMDPVAKRLHTLRERSRKRGVPFDLDYEYLNNLITADCPVFKVPIKFNVGRACRWSISIDRIKPELGYVKGNIVVMSKLANAMKQDASPQELLAFAAWINATFGEPCAEHK